MESEFLYNPKGVGSHCHAATLATDGKDLFAAWYAYPEREHEQGTLAFSRRREHEKWEKPRRIELDVTSSCANPVLVHVGSGELWLFFVLVQGSYWNDAVVYVSKSVDEGVSWGSPQNLGMPPGTMVRDRPMITSQGGFLLPAYDEQSRRSFLLNENSISGSWKIAHQFPAGYLQAAPVYLGNHEWQLYFRPWSDPRFIHRAYSADDGKTWSEPIPTSLPCPLSGLAVTSLNGKIIVIHNHTEQHQRTPLSVSVSSDRGLSWQQPWHIDQVSFEVSYPTAVTTSDEKIHVLYTYNRRMIKQIVFTFEEMESRQ